MDRRSPLIIVMDPAQIASGLAPDRHALFVPLMEVMENARAYQGKIERIIPAAQAFTTTAFPSRGLHQQQLANGTRYVFHAAIDNDGMPVYRWYGPAAEFIYGPGVGQKDQTGANPATYMDFTSWGDWTIINTGIGKPFVYKPAGGSAEIADAPSDFVRLLKKQNHLMAVGTGLNKKGFAWSDADDINNWDPLDTTGIAGDGTIEELDTPIRAAERLGNYVAAYAEDQMGLISWAGAPFYYGQRVQLDGIGAVGKLAVCSDGRLNYGVSRNGIWRTDGQSFDYIDTGTMVGYLQENVNWAQGSKIIAGRNDVTRCFEFHFPIQDELEVSEAWSFDPTNGAWSRVPAYQVMQERKLLDKPIVAENGTVYMLDSNAGLPAPLSMVTKPMMAAAGDKALHQGCKMDKFEFALRRASNIEFRYGVGEDTGGPWSWSDWQELDSSLKSYDLEPGIPSGVFHKLELRSTADNWAMDLQGFAIFGEPDGTKRDRS